MASQMRKTAVGAFVVGGLALFALALMLLGGGKIFQDSLEYTLYFDGSVSGLAIGAPVVFRGVPLGNVIKISLVANPRDSNVTIPVTIRINDRSFIRASGQSLSENAQAEIIHRMVERGLRARLQLASFITGQYRVELDFFPEAPMNFRSSVPETEIPTIPSPIDTLQRVITMLPLEQIADSLMGILNNITDALGQGQLKKALEEFGGAAHAARTLLSDSPVLRLAEQGIGRLDNTVAEVEKQLGPALLSFQKAMNEITRTAAGFREVAASTEGAIGRESPLMNEVRRMVRELTAAARALRNFTDMLERNPEALIKGRQGSR